MKSTSEEWHSEEEEDDNETDIENDAERGICDNEVSAVGVVKPHRGKLHPQVSASLLGFFNMMIRIICDG